MTVLFMLLLIGIIISAIIALFEQRLQEIKLHGMDDDENDIEEEFEASSFQCMKGLLDTRAYFQATSNDPKVFEALKLLEQESLKKSAQERQKQPRITDDKILPLRICGTARM